MSKQKSVGFHSPLNKNDTQKETMGCRHTNPDICSKNSLEGVCAFVRNDGVCKSPPKTWAKQYVKIKMRKAGIVN